MNELRGDPADGVWTSACVQCNRLTSVRIETCLDTRSRPELLELLRSRQYFERRCDCGRAFQVPLAILVLVDDGRTLFIPPDTDSDGDSMAALVPLLGRLSDDERLAIRNAPDRCVHHTPRYLLPVALAPESEVRGCIQSLSDLLTARDNEALHRVLLERRALQTPAAEAGMYRILAAEPDENRRARFEYFLKMLLELQGFFPEEVEQRAAKRFHHLENALAKWHKARDVASNARLLRRTKALLDLLPGDAGQRAMLLSLLAEAQCEKYRLTFDREALAAAVATSTTAVHLTPPGAHMRAVHLGVYADVLFHRFSADRCLSDLDEAISLSEASLAGAEDKGSHDRRKRLAHYHRVRDRSKLALAGRTSLQSLDEALAGIDDEVDEARSVARNAPTIERASKSAELVDALLHRYRVYMSPTDLEEGVALCGQLLRQDGIGPRLAHQLSAITEMLGERFDDRLDQMDLNLAISMSGRGIGRLKAHKEGRALLLINQSENLLRRHRVQAKRRDLRHAVALAVAALSEGEDLKAHGEQVLRVAVVALARQIKQENARPILRAIDLRRFLSGDRILSNGRREVIELGRQALRHHQFVASNGGATARLAEGCAEGLLNLLERDESVEEVVALLEALQSGRIQGNAGVRKSLSYSSPVADPLSLGEIETLSRATDQAIVYIRPLFEAKHRVLVVLVLPAKRSGGQSKIINDANWPSSDPIAMHLGGIGAVLAGSTKETFLTQTGVAAALRPGFQRGLQNTFFFESMSAIGKCLMQPIADALRAAGVTRVALVPGGNISALPLHAAPIDGEYPFCDIFEVTYAPSASLLAAVLARPKLEGNKKTTVVGVANPDGSMSHSDSELLTAGLFLTRGHPDQRAHIRHGEEATREWLLKSAPIADILVLSTHATFDIARPEESYFVLGRAAGYSLTTGTPELAAIATDDSRRLRLGDIWRGDLRLKPGALVIAGACEAAQVQLGVGGLSGGFPSAFLAAGARSVIAPLWRVDDLASALLLEELYMRLSLGASPPIALRIAARFLRTLSRARVLQGLSAEIALLSALATRKEENSDPRASLARLRRVEALRDALKRISRSDDEFPFAAPFYWAAFIASGAPD